MTNVSVKGIINASADDVWKTVSSFSEIENKTNSKRPSTVYGTISVPYLGTEPKGRAI